MSGFEHAAPIGAPAGAHPLDAITTLALMYANSTPLIPATEVLFIASDLKDTTFTCTDIVSPSPNRTHRYYVSSGLLAMAAAGLLHVSEDVGVGGALSYRATDMLPRVVDDYNYMYVDILADQTSIDPETIWNRSAQVLGGAYFERDNMPAKQSNVLAGVSRMAEISLAHAMRRALAGYACALGSDTKVNKEIERQVRNHPRSKGGPRAKYIKNRAALNDS